MEQKRRSVTDEDLRAAFERYKHQRLAQAWPKTFEEAMQIQLVKGMLNCLARGMSQKMVLLQPKLPRPKMKPAPKFDIRRLASGEKESDYD